MEQRAGRTVRQGNKNKKVDIIRYVTEGTFDAYLYQIIENKQKFISQVMTSKSPARSIEDIDEAALSYAEIKALATGNVHIKEKMDLDIQVSKLQLLKQNFLNQRYEMEDKVIKYYPNEIKNNNQLIKEFEQDIALAKENTPSDRDTFPPMEIQGTIYHNKKAAGEAIIEVCKTINSPKSLPFGNYRGFSMELSYNSFSQEYRVTLKGKKAYNVDLGTDMFGNITRIDNKIEKIADRLLQCREYAKNLEIQFANAKVEAVREFPKEQELAEKVARLGELNVLLNLTKKENVILGDDTDNEKQTGVQKKEDFER